MTREKLPDRRANWTESVVVGGHLFIVTFGEFADGRLGEIFLHADKEGTFVRGILDAVARLVSLSLQSGVPPATLANALKGLNFSPSGYVFGSEVAQECSSIMDWLGKEIEAYYGGLCSD